MKNLFENTTDILDAEKILENYFNPNKNKTNQLGSLPVTEQDCNFLLSAFNRLKENHTSIKLYEKIPLSILTLWTFSIKYRDINPDFYDNVMSYSLPQHHYKLYIEILSNAIDEYSIENFGINYTSSTGLEKLINIHAGEEFSSGICA